MMQSLSFGAKHNYDTKKVDFTVPEEPDRRHGGCALLS
jgi:hypothetical protein